MDLRPSLRASPSPRRGAECREKTGQTVPRAVSTREPGSPLEWSQDLNRPLADPPGEESWGAVSSRPLGRVGCEWCCLSGTGACRIGLVGTPPSPPSPGSQKEAVGSPLRREPHPSSLQERWAVDQGRVTRPPQKEEEEEKASLCQGWAKAALLEQPPEERCSGPGASCQASREQAWEPCSQGCGGSWRQGQDCPAEKQSLDLLQHQCQVLKDQLFCYEEESQELELSQLQEREEQRQEQLAQLKHRVGLLEHMLGLYRMKYQAVLGRAGELESQRQAEELAGQAHQREEAAWRRRSEQLSLQEELRSRSRQLARAEDTIAQLVQELRGAREDLAQGQQDEETIQELQAQLASSHAKFLDQEEALAALRRDFSAYRLAHAYANSSYEGQAAQAEALQKALQQQKEDLRRVRLELGHAGSALQESRKEEERAAQELERLRIKLQQQAAEGLRREATLSQLHVELHAAQEREQQSSQALAAAQVVAQDLQRQAASCQASQREALEQLEERGREVFRLHTDLRLHQHKEAHLEEELATRQEQAQQLRSDLQTLQRQREEEACSSQERLGRLEGEAQRWRDEHRVAERALADREEELVVLKVELATLEEKGHTAAEEVRALSGERTLAQRLLRESELMEATVSQWVMEQKQVNEKLGHKIRDQIKRIAQLTGERDHLQGLAERLQQEKKHLKDEVDELHIEQERFKALHSKAGDPRAEQRQPWPRKEPPPQCPGQRPSRAFIARRD